MSSGGGTNTVTQQSGPPAQVLANYQQVYNQAQNIAAQPSQPYSGSTIAGFTPMQEAGFNDVNTAANAAQPFQNAAAQDVTNAATTIDPSNFGGTVSQYESPYTADVLKATEAAEMNTDAQQEQQMAGNAVSAGAWGGDRSAVLQGITAGQQAIANNATNANLENTGFQNATSAAESNAYLNSSAGAELGALGQTAQAEGLTAANAELTAGGTQQQQEQNELNIPYESYLAATANPQQETNWLEGMATGTGSLSGTSGSTTSPGPNVLSQVAGLGLGATGVVGATGGFGPNGYVTNAINGSGGASAAGAAADTSLNSEFLNGAQAIEDIARGGRVPHFSPGGAVVNVDAGSGLLGGGGNMLGAGGNLLGGGGNLLTTPTGTVSTTTGGPSGIGQLIGLGGQIAASVYGGPWAGAAAGAFNQAVGLRDGGTAGFAPHHARDIDDFAKRIAGLRPVPVRPRGFDTGGGISPSLTASVGGNPMLVQAAQTYNGLPTDQLKQMAARYPASTPQGALVQRALQMRQLYPQSNPGQPTAGAQATPSAPQPGIGPMGVNPQSPVSPTFARGGETDDDDSIPDLVIPAPGPSVPGGLAAGLSPIAQPTTTPETLLTQHAMAMGKSGSYVPPPPELAPLVVDAAQRHNVDPKALAWMLSQESHWNPNAYNPESGTIGLGQFKPATAREEGIDPRDPVQAIDGAAHYLSKQLARSGGDYETAIGHYGTFSTGHGKDADNAVRGQFRAFMQGAARGGAIHLADGGDPNYVDPSGLLMMGATASDQPSAGFGPINISASSPVGQSAGLAPLPPPPPAPPTAGITDGSGNSIPPPPTLATASPDDKSEGRASIKASPWEALLTAGLDMMAGTSPHALTNIGAGGLAGVKDYQQQKQLAIQDQTRQDVAATNAVWRAGQLGNLQDKTKLAQAIAATRTPLIQAQTDAASARAAALEAEKPKYQFQPVTQPDPNDPDRTVSGVMQLDPSGKVAPKFIQTDTNPNKGPGAAAKPKFQYIQTTTPDPDDPTKTISGFSKIDPTGQIDPQFIRTDTNPNKGGGAGAGMGGRESVYLNRVTQAGNAATAALSNIMELPTTASTGFFGGRQQGPGLLAAGKEALTNTLTSQGVQDYNTMISGVARNLATLESAGLAPGGAFTHSMDSIMLKEGDTEATKMRKLAEARQIIEKNLEPNLSNPRIPQQQRDMIQGIVTNVQKAVPFTQHDITAFQNSPATTMTQFATSKNLGQPVAAPPAPTWKYNATGKRGATLHSNDGSSWFTPDGKPYAP